MKINRGNWLHLLGYNKTTQRYSKWGKLLVLSFWPVAILEAIVWVFGETTWWTLLINGLAIIYALLMVPTLIVNIIRNAYREDKQD